MKIRMTVSMAGPGFTCNAGDQLEVEDEQGATLIDAGFAELDEAEDQPDKPRRRAPRRGIEKAVAPTPDTPEG